MQYYNGCMTIPEYGYTIQPLNMAHAQPCSNPLRPFCLHSRYPPNKQAYPRLGWRTNTKNAEKWLSFLGLEVLPISLPFNLGNPIIKLRFGDGWNPSRAMPCLLPRSTTMKTHFQLSQGPGFSQIFRLLQGQRRNKKRMARSTQGGHERTNEQKYCTSICVCIVLNIFISLSQ